MIDDFISSILNKKIYNKFFYVHFKNCSTFLLTIERDFFNSILINLIFIDFIIILFLLFLLFILLLIASMNDRWCFNLISNRTIQNEFFHVNLKNCSNFWPIIQQYFITPIFNNSIIIIFLLFLLLTFYYHLVASTVPWMIDDFFNSISNKKIHNQLVHVRFKNYSNFSPTIKQRSYPSNFAIFDSSGPFLNFRIGI